MYRHRIIIALIIGTFTVSPLIPSASAGVGARHFMEGAVFAKYLTKTPEATRRSHIQTYSAAFLVGMISHGISDHFGNYEPHSDQPEYYYFIGEGLAGCVLLYPEWRKDPRLFAGSIGGAFPDIDQMEPFGRKVYPTHNGEIPHFRLQEFWRGAAVNLAINGLAYWAIREDLFPDEEFRSRFSLGYSLGYWNSQGAQRRGVEKWPSGKNGTPHRQIRVSYDPFDHLTMNLTIGDWMRDVRGDFDQDYPPRVNIDSYSLCAELHPQEIWRLTPYVAVGPSLYMASMSGAVDQGNISFSSHVTASLGVQGGGGLKVALSRYVRLVIDQRFHEVRFRDDVDGTACYSGWSTGIGIDHKL